MKYTIAELKAAKSFAEIQGETKTGSTDSVKYKRVALADSETHAEAIIVSYNGGAIVVIDRPENRAEFLARGC